MIAGRKIDIRCTSLMDVQLGPRVMPLAMSSGLQRLPQPCNRHATLYRWGVDTQWFRSRSIMPAQAQKTFYDHPERPLKGAVSANKHNVKLCAVVLWSLRQTAPRTISRLRIIYIILNALNRHCAAQLRAQAHGFLWHPPSPSLHTACAAFPAQQPAVVVPWFCSWSNVFRLSVVLKHRQSRGQSGWSAAAKRKRVSGTLKGIKAQRA